MEISVVIPTRGRPARLAACLASLAAQDLPMDRFEVLVGFDGPDPETAALALVSWQQAGGAPGSLVVRQFDRLGYQAVRNALLPDARGRILLSTNDDVIADPAFVRTHAQEHAAAGRCVVISGASPWRVHQPDRLFDRLIRETSMVFFADRMDDADPARVWGFRHAWGLNMSMPTDAVRRVGGFVVLPGHYGYEDSELAHALAARFGAPVLFRPAAIVEHDHRMEPEDYLQREYRLGFAAVGLALQRGECARAIFNRNILASVEIDYSRQFVARERGAAAQAWDGFRTLADLPASAVDSPHGPALMRLLYQQHLPLKRWCWRRGLLDSFEGRACEPTGVLQALNAVPVPARSAARHRRRSA